MGGDKLVGYDTPAEIEPEEVEGDKPTLEERERDKEKGKKIVTVRG